ncbi:hypothetical protein M409DRAFT_35917 [Zasmidium cellare ATCC 36951]|uniref:Cytochrome P450 n=1 Tax=Zasmidium cellare ATCC 36951 TaxID=1080233 RepID=A0A6A6CTK0_ZASCE|nr:uncharacterized protein M409DRAFT_35917 [Zasmidium cellare ATCC 36951]KAF2170474.1 hypothetical protein M409DRAFT_35917 [Zasmidium cellare ATCC 36951]
MKHSFLFGHLLVVRQFYKDWASDANFIQTFGYYISKHWAQFFPEERSCPPVVYVDVWPIATPMAFSLEAYVSNQIELGRSLPKSPMQGEFLRPISNGKDLNCMHGEEWRMWRSRLNPAFSKSNIRSWVPCVVEEVESFVAVLQGLAVENGGWGPVFQLEKVSGDLACDITGRIVVNEQFRSLSSRPAPFARLYRRQLEEMEITMNIFKLIWRATPLFKWHVARRRHTLFDELRPLIFASMDSTTEQPCTVAQSALKQDAVTTIKPQLLSCPVDADLIEQVCCQLMIFFFGGEDAVSIVIPWMVNRSAANSECLDKIRVEHDAVLGPDPSLGLDKIRESPHLLDSLPYSHAVIKETLRLNPATITIREGQPDFTLEIKGSDKRWPTDGFDLFDSSITIHRDEKNFSRPLEFLPERYLVSEGHELHPPKNTWRGFQLGPRQCIGQELATVLLKLVLISVVRTFDAELAWADWDTEQERKGMKSHPVCVDGDRMYTTGRATSHPKDGAPAHVRTRC